MKRIMLILILIFTLLIPQTVKSLTKSVFISEILPDAIGADSGKEWIEIYNYTDSPINIKDYYFINRSASGSERKVIVTQNINIASKQYFIISEGSINIASESIYLIGAGKINLFNDESDLELYDAQNNFLDSIHYSKPQEGKSLERKGPEDILDCSRLVLNTSEPTILTDNSAKDPVCYGEASVNPPVNNDECISIGLLLDNLANSNLCTKGSVSVAPNILGEKVFYIQDAGLGMKVKLKLDLTFNIKDNDLVKVTGTLKKITDGLYLSADEVELIGNKAIYPSKLIDFKLQKYSFVNYVGKILKNYSKSMDLSFNDSAIRISVLASTEITMPERTVGDKLNVTGILIEEGGIFKVLPRYQEDIFLVEEEIPLKSSEENVKTESPKQIIKNGDIKNTFNHLPLLQIKREESKKVNVKYILSRFILISIVTVLFLTLNLILFRKKIKDYLTAFVFPKRILLAEKEISFDKDRYQMIFE